MPKIYVASLADYNCGYLQGVWIALDEHTDLEDVTEQVDAMLKDSPDSRTWPVVRCGGVRDSRLRGLRGLPGAGIHLTS